MTHKVDIRKFKASDATELKNKGGIIKGNYWCDFETDARNAELMGPGWTFIIEGEIVACAGAWIGRPGVGELWGLFSPKSKEIKRELLFYTKKYTAKIVKDFNIRWLQATPKCDFEGGIILLQHLGFEKKCRMEGYAPDGSDCFLYSLKG